MNIKVSGHGYSFQLTRALLLYEDGDSAVATIHAATNGVIREGHPVSAEVIEQVLRALHKVKPQVIPENLLYHSAKRVVWWVPSHLEKIWFAIDNDKDKPLQRFNNRTLNHPPLLFMVDGSLSVYALKKNARPKLNTELLNAPYLNVRNGLVCQGNVNLTLDVELEAQELMTRAQRVFFDTKFTHTQEPHKKLTNHPKGLVGYYADAECGEQWARKWLVSAKKTMEQIL